MTATTDRFVVTRTIAATPAEIFAVLADPCRHQNCEPTDWVRDAVDTAPITGTGQMFAMNMFLEQAGGHYVTYNLVNVFDKDRAIGWVPGRLDDAGNHSPAAGSGATTLRRTGTAPTSLSPMTGTPRHRISATRSAVCPCSRRTTSPRRWRPWSAR